jgi:hypothetical protein
MLCVQEHKAVNNAMVDALREQLRMQKALMDLETARLTRVCILHLVSLSLSHFLSLSFSLSLLPALWVYVCGRGVARCLG